MQLSHVSHFSKRKKGDVLVLPYWKGKSVPEFAAAVKEKFPSLVKDVLKTGDFKGFEGEVLFIYVEGELESRFCLLGLGDKTKANRESFRSAFSALTKACLAKQMKQLNVLLPNWGDPKSAFEMISSVAEGILLTNYQFKKYKSAFEKEDSANLVESVTFIGEGKEVLKEVDSAKILSNGVCLARDLVNANADEVIPSYLAKCAKDLFSKLKGVKVTVFDEARLKKEKLDLILAVGRGSHNPPFMIVVEYVGNPQSEEKVVLVGKGVTYDTGGLNLKPTGSLETMKCDMSGAAVCLGAMKVVCDLKLKVNFSIVIPTVENGIDAKSFKPGDVYTSYLGKSVEMTNSDAEGRLILADALAYSVKNLQPTALIDIATLTGAIEVALGPEAAGLMSCDDRLSSDLIIAGEKTHERLWRMPLFEEYKERLKSDIADIKSWNGRSAASNVAATFLRAFVDEKTPWAHIDIAAVAYVSESRKYNPKYATGFGVRLIIQWLKDCETSSIKR